MINARDFLKPIPQWTDERCEEAVVWLINSALTIKLTEDQVNYLFRDVSIPSRLPCEMSEVNPCVMHVSKENCEFLNDKVPWRCNAYGRRQGRTTAYCIKLALSKGERIRDISKFADGEWGQRYARGFFKYTFHDIWSALKSAGFKVREVIF